MRHGKNLKLPLHQLLLPTCIEVETGINFRPVNYLLYQNPFFLLVPKMKPYIEFIEALQNSGFWLAKVQCKLRQPFLLGKAGRLGGPLTSLRAPERTGDPGYIKGLDVRGWRHIPKVAIKDYQFCGPIFSL